MNVPVPPRPVRRLLVPVVVVVAFALLLVVLVLVALVAVLSLRRRRRRLLRLLLMVAAALQLEIRVDLGAGLLWLRRALGRSDPGDWRRDHVQLLGSALHRFFSVAQAVVGLDVDVQCDAPMPSASSGPRVVLSRHAGVGDSLLLVYLVTHRLGRVPRVVLKRMLLWDPAMDLVLGRLGAHFLPPQRVSRRRARAQLWEFVQSVDDDSAVLIFPEGRTWTPHRHDSELADAVGHGNEERAHWLAAHPLVLTPHSTGARTALAAHPGGQLVTVRHRGLEQLYSLPQIWRALPFDRPVEVGIVEHAMPALGELQDWLEGVWADIDDWTRARVSVLPRG